MTKHPSQKKVSLQEIKKDYHAPFINKALAEYIVSFNNPDFSDRQVKSKAKNYTLSMNSIAVYHQAKVWLGSEDHPQLSTDEIDTIHARPSCTTKTGKKKAAQFDIALVSNGSGQYIGLDGK